MDGSPKQDQKRRISFSGSPGGGNDRNKDKSPPRNSVQPAVRRASTVDLAEKVKEFFKRFDKNGDGLLDYGELTKAMKSLTGITDETVLKKYCEMDTNNNKLVTMKEFVNYTLNGPESRMFRQQLQNITGEARKAQLREVFNRYDASNDGNLDVPELETVLKSLGAFTHHEVMKVCQDLDTSGDGQVSFNEWLEWFSSGQGGHVVTKAKAILAPGDDDGLESVFYMFCSSGRSDMDSQSFIRMCRDANLLDKKLTDTRLDLIFKNCKRRGEKRLVLDRFDDTLKNVAESKGVPPAEVRNALLQVCGPKLLGTKAVGPEFSSPERGRKASAEIGIKRSSTTALRRSTSAEGRGSATGLSRSTSRRASTAENGSNAEDSPSGKRSSSSPSSPTGKNTALESTALDPPVDNRKLWKTFGIDMPVGRQLKTLYGGGKLEPRLKHAKKISLDEEETYLVVNGLNSGSAGLQFRKTTNIFDICRGTREFVAWGEVVRGIRVDAAWLKVGEKYLPTHVNKVKFLRRKHTPPSPLGRSQSTPDLSKFSKEGKSMWGGSSVDFELVGKLHSAFEAMRQPECDEEPTAVS